jgi:hypothetical protein
MMACTCHPTCGRKPKIGGLFMASLDHKQDPISKMAGGMAQAVQHLLCKALSSNLIVAKKKERRKKEGRNRVLSGRNFFFGGSYFINPFKLFLFVLFF